MIEEAVAAIRRGEPLVVPTDTVYGLVASPRDEPVRRLYRLKGREPSQPSALMAPSLEMLFELVPELRGRAGLVARALLPGAYTLVLPNPARRYGCLTGERQDAIGVRVPELPEPTASILEQAGAFVATSANLAGGEEPARVDEVPQQLRDGVALVIDGGVLPGVPSTVIDFTGEQPRVLREGAAPGAEAVERALAALA